MTSLNIRQKVIVSNQLLLLWVFFMLNLISSDAFLSLQAAVRSI